MGWGRIQELPGIFAQALSTAKKGDIVGPIRSGVGFHLLKVNDLRGRKQKYLGDRSSYSPYSAQTVIADDEQARVKLEQIAADIKSGKTTFAAAAKEFSQDPGSANCRAAISVEHTGYFCPAFRDA